MFNAVTGYLRTRRDHVIDDITITLFLRITRCAPAPILSILIKELLRELARRRPAEDVPEPEQQTSPPVGILSLNDSRR